MTNSINIFGSEVSLEDMVTEENHEQIVSSWALYNFLELRKADYSRWIRANLKSNDYAIENVDYTEVEKDLRSHADYSNNKVPIHQDYHLRLDFAKKLCMVARSRKGEQARNYFIEIEKKYKADQLPKTYSAALYEAARLAEKNEQQKKQLLEDKPKVEFYNDVTGSEDTIDIGNSAKVLNFGIGRNKLFEILRDLDVLMQNNQPYQKYIDCEYFRVIEQKYNKPDGSVHINLKTVVYQKGLDFIRKILKERGYKEGSGYTAIDDVV